MFICMTYIFLGVILNGFRDPGIPHQMYPTTNHPLSIAIHSVGNPVLRISLLCIRKHLYRFFLDILHERDHGICGPTL